MSSSSDDVVSPVAAAVTEEELIPAVKPSQSNNFVEIEVKDIRDMVSPGGRRQTVLLEDDEDDDEYYEDDEDEDDTDPFKNLISDARRLRGGKDAEEEEFNIGMAIKNVISTIVTADFFVVFGLLLWFLSGIFCSYVLKNDAVQIAFNGIFEPVVQPALGLLMVASAAGAIAGGDEDDN